MKIFLFTIFGLIYCGSSAQELDCSTVRTGTFSIKTQIDKIGINRSDSISVENSRYYKKMTINTIEWLDDCSFILKYKSGDIPPEPYGKNHEVCEIIEIDGRCHIEKCKIQGTDIMRENELCR